MAESIAREPIEARIQGGAGLVDAAAAVDDADGIVTKESRNPDGDFGRDNARPPFYVVFGRKWSRIGLDFPARPNGDNLPILTPGPSAGDFSQFRPIRIHKRDHTHVARVLPSRDAGPTAGARSL